MPRGERENSPCMARHGALGAKLRGRHKNHVKVREKLLGMPLKPNLTLEDT